MTSLICAACGENLSVKSALEMSLRCDFQALIGGPSAIACLMPHSRDAPRPLMFRRVAAAPMHLKRYQIDGRLLRSDAANFSASGLKRQDNDLIVIESGNAAVEFKHAFDARFDSGEALPRSTRQWRMDHPRVLGLLIVAVYLFKRLDAHLEKHNPFDCRIYHELSEGEEDPILPPQLFLRLWAPSSRRQFFEGALRAYTWARRSYSAIIGKIESMAIRRSRRHGNLR